MDISDWITVGASAIAVLSAVAAIRQVAHAKAQAIATTDQADSARQSIEIQEEIWQESRRERIKAERRAQADRIAAWFALKETDEFEGDMFGAFVRNASDLPVFDVMPDFIEANYGEPSTAGSSTFCGGISVVPPHDTKFVELDVVADEEFLNAPEHLRDTMYLVGIEFRDAAGIRWRRDADGTLTEVNR